MATTIEQAKEIVNQYNALETDRERLEFIAKNSDDLELILDNDDTSVFLSTPFDLDEDVKDRIDSFSLRSLDSFIGNAPGVYLLLEILGIRGQAC